MSDPWYYAKDGKPTGPFSLKEIGVLLSQSTDYPLVWRSGFPGWVRAEDVKDLAPYLVRPPPLVSAGKDRFATSTPRRFNSWLLGFLLVAGVWAISGYVFYRDVTIITIVLAAGSILALIATAWRRQFRFFAGCLLGVGLGIFAKEIVVNERLDFDKATALGFSSASDMREAARLNLTPQQLATRHAAEAARVAAEQKHLAEQEAAINACRNDWSKCADNGEIVNKYSDWSMVQVRCKIAADNQARYGDPQWPSGYFGTYLRGNDYVKTGVAVAIEPDARFQNGFGAMVHSEVICKYDLRAKKVVDVSIAPK